MRVLHIGNIANNAYNIAKALREHGIEADCYTDYYRHYISQPEWEDADLEEIPVCSEYAPVEWEKYDLHGFARPDWYMESREEALARILRMGSPAPYLRILDFMQADGGKSSLAAYWQEICASDPATAGKHIREIVKIIWGQLPLEGGDFPTAQLWRRSLEEKFLHACSRWHSPLAPKDYARAEQAFLPYFLSRYDVIQTYGAFQLFYPALHAPAVPQITFEHGTMREFPFQDSSNGRLAMLAYKRSFANIITNADAIHNAKRMGLKNCVFIPHPVDDSKFKPLADKPFRKKLLEEHDATHLFLAPARQNWELKGNDRIIRGFAKLLAIVGKGPVLLLGGWGQEIERSSSLVAQLGLKDHVAWLPPMPKKMLARYINASDAVLDQFMLGAFGTTTPEAMACAKPVLLYYNKADHAWCLPEAPPVVNVRDAEDIARALLKLYENPAYAEKAGRDSLAWFKRFHSMKVVVERHLELYASLEKSPHVIKLPQALMENEIMRNVTILCFINAASASGATVRQWLRGVNGKSALEILDRRLKRIHPACHFILATNGNQETLQDEALRLGWRVEKDANGEGEFLLSPAWIGESLFAGVDFVYVCSLEEPFMEEAQIKAWKICEWPSSTIVSGENWANPYIPKKIYSHAFVEYRQKLRELFKDHFTPLQDQSIMVRYGMSIPAPNLAAEAVKLNLANMADLAPGLDPVSFALADLGNVNRLQVLKNALPGAANPQAINEELNALETESRSTELASFPTFVGLNLTSVCSAHCSFCSIQPKEQKYRDAITLEEVKKMDWLRYVKVLSIWGGIGDSLVNRDFLPIVRYLHATFPDLKLDLSTNGILLNEEICQTLANTLTSFNVSLNAASRSTWEKMMRAKGFDRVCQGIKRLSEMRKSKCEPSIAVSFVITHDNIHEAVDFVNLAGELGADRVTFVHYVPTTLVGRRDLAPEQSMYLDKGLSDKMLLAAEQRANELGLAFTGPTLFNKNARYIHFGSRALTPPQQCRLPWQTCYLTVDEDGKRQMIFCCSSFYYQIAYDKSSLDEAGFKKLWNHPTAQYFRATVHQKGANPICEYCTTIDRFDPENRQNLEIDKIIQPAFETINQKYEAGVELDITQIADSIKNHFESKNAK